MFATNLATATDTLFVRFVSLWDGESHTATFDVAEVREVARALPCSNRAGELAATATPTQEAAGASALDLYYI